MSTRLGAVPKPYCVPLGGCIGQAFCDYCGRPIPAPTEARSRLATLIEQLRQSLRGVV